MTRNNSKNNFNIAKIYGAKVFDDTVHYQKNIIGKWVTINGNHVLIKD